jgi:HAE1 family hydrophobic/amphiphilic exporter-1
MWHLSKLASRNRIITLIVALLLAGASIWALLGLKMELIPNINFPYATIFTVYPEATPDTVASQVTSPIEKVVWEKWSNQGLKHLTSTSSKGISVIMAEFEFGMDMQKITASIEKDIQQLALPQAVSDFPKMMGTDSKNPQIIPIDMSMMPLVVLSVNGDLPPEQLKQIAVSQIVPEMENIEGVLRMDTEGGESDQIVITADPEKMNQYGVSMGPDFRSSGRQIHLFGGSIQYIPGIGRSQT